MKVRTLNEITFKAACRDLEERIVASGFEPDLVIGIATGGEYVASSMFEDVAHLSICRRRPSSSLKEKDGAGIVFRILRRSPRYVADGLRILESRLYRLRPAKHKREPVVLSADGQASILASKRVLIVDDAVDSGSTLSSVLQAVQAVQDERDVRTAAITVTTRRPAVSPDYALYRNSTLIRFPWSKDYYPV